MSIYKKLEDLSPEAQAELARDKKIEEAEEYRRELAELRRKPNFERDQGADY